MNTDNDEIFRDPTLALPSELVSHLISSLPPVSKARSNAVSKSWRQLILSDPSLHKEVDLSRLGATTQMNDLIRHFDRLSALALHRLLDVSFNLSCFWQVTSLEIKQDTPANLDLLLNTLQLSRGSLKSFSFKVDCPSIDSANLPNSLAPKILRIINQVETFPHLEEVKIEAPCHVSLKAGDDLVLKRFILSKNATEMCCRDQIADVLSSIKKVGEFTKVSLTEALFNRGFQCDSWDVSQKILSSLSDSQPTLQSLAVEGLFSTVDFWNMSVNCPNLGSLSTKMFLLSTFQNRPGSLRLGFESVCFHF